MAKSDFLNSLNALSRKIDALLAQQKILQEKVLTLEKENLELKKRHSSDEEALEKAKQEIEFLTLSHRLADSPEALILARNKIASLIRTIDSCIRLINEE